MKIKEMIMNWRYWVLYILLALTMMAMMCMSDDVRKLILSKVVFVALAGIVALLVRYWSGKGVIQDPNRNEQI